MTLVAIRNPVTSVKFWCNLLTMFVPKKIHFGAYTLNTAYETLHRGAENIHLRPKTFALLQYLAVRPGRLITKDELLDGIWSDCNIGEEAIKHCMREIRLALGDNARMPLYVETVHRRGYRFIGKAGDTRKDGTNKFSNPIPFSDPSPHENLIVGRKSHLATMGRLYEKTCGGARQVLFISGKRGIGKTRLTDAFLETVASSRPVGSHSSNAVPPFVARGQCVQLYGKAEAYMPLLEALTGLCRPPSGRRIINILCRHAPLWMSQMPSQLSAAQILRIRISTRSASRDRMLRELAEALEELTLHRPMILVLEDLHWSDPSTLDWLMYWAKRRNPARLLLMATYSPVEVSSQEHPLHTLIPELQLKRQCLELPLYGLEEKDIEEYLLRRFPSRRFLPETASWIRQQTGGNPRLMADLLGRLEKRAFVTGP